MLPLKNILVAKDFSPGSDKALHYALDLARRTDATVYVVHVAPPPGPSDDTASEADHSDGVFLERLMESVRRPSREGGAFDTAGLWMNYVVERDEAPASALLRYADVHDVDLIVMGTHGRRGLRRLLIRSVAEEVVRQAACPVLTVRQREGGLAVAGAISTLLVPIDFTPHAREALRAAKQLAALYQARLDLLHALDLRVPVIPESLQEELKQFYRATEGPSGPIAVIVVVDDPASAISRYAARYGSDLIVMATHGRTGMEHFLMGSIAEKVVREAPCAVLTTKTLQQIALRQHRGAIAAVEAG